VNLGCRPTANDQALSGAQIPHHPDPRRRNFPNAIKRNDQLGDQNVLVAWSAHK